MKIKRFCFLLSFFSALFANAQVAQTARIDLPVGSDNQVYSVISLGVSGIILFRNFTGQPTNVLEVIRYDTSLHQAWQKFVPVPRGFFSIKSKVSNGSLYFLFGSHLPGIHDYHVTMVDTTDGYTTSYTIKNEIKFNETGFAVSKEAILISGYLDYRPIILRYSVTEKRLTPLSGLSNQIGELAQLVMYPNGESDAVISGENSLRQKCLWIENYNNNGEHIKSTALIPDEGKNLIFGKTSKNKNNNQLVAGVYGYDLQHPQGIFTAVIDSGVKNTIHYYNFSVLKGFFSDKKPEREKHLKALHKQKKTTGEKTNFRHRYVVQDIIPVENRFVMINEAFYPNRLINSFYFQNVILRDNDDRPVRGLPTLLFNFYSPWTYGLPKKINESGEFVSYNYTRALVIGLTESGKPEWDNTIVTQDFESPMLEENIKFLPKDGEAILLYLFDNTVNYQKIKAGIKLTPIIQETIKTFDGQEIVEYDVNNKLLHWYENNFFVYGTETLHRHTIELEVHKVFFINKLRVH